MRGSRRYRAALHAHVTVYKNDRNDSPEWSPGRLLPIRRGTILSAESDPLRNRVQESLLSSVLRAVESPDVDLSRKSIFLIDNP